MHFVNDPKPEESLRDTDESKQPLRALPSDSDTGVLNAIPAETD